MEHMKYIIFSGAPLPLHVGKIFTSSGIRIIPDMGSTEVGSYGLRLAPSLEDWMYYIFDPETGFEFRHFYEDLYKSVIVKHKKAEKADRKLIFHVFPELEEYHIRDIWRCVYISSLLGNFRTQILLED
jgi:hypothetical protein